MRIRDTKKRDQVVGYSLGSTSVRVLFPTRSFVETLCEGCRIVDVFGKTAVVTEISYKGDDVNGRRYVGGYCFNGTTKVSFSLKEDDVLRTVPLCSEFKSREIDSIEEDLRSARRCEMV